MDRLITWEGTELDLGPEHELEESIIPFRLREVLCEFAEASRWRRHRDEYLDPLCFTVWSPDEKALAQRDYARRIRAQPQIAEQQRATKAARDAERFREKMANPDTRESIRTYQREYLRGRYKDPAYVEARKLRRKELRLRKRLEKP